MRRTHVFYVFCCVACTQPAVDAKEWRTHLEQTRRHDDLLREVFPDTKAALMRIGDELHKVCVSSHDHSLYLFPDTKATLMRICDEIHNVCVSSHDRSLYVFPYSVPLVRRCTLKRMV